jgi:uncharacterized protein
MPKAVAFAAVDLIVENALQTGMGPCMVQFHGGGEPTCAWNLLVRVVEYLEARTRREGLPHFVGLTTNGAIPEERLAWLADHVSDLCISLDGPREIQDRQRPKLSGAGSFSNLQRTLDFLDQRGVQYYTVATVTGESTGALSELASILAGRPCCTAMFLEPVVECGEFRGEGVTVPTAEAFLKAFRAAEVAGRQRGLPVRYAAARIDVLTNRACEAPTPSFTVTPSGDVTACYMVTERGHPRADFFFHGRYDHDSGSYIFDPDARARLRSYHVDYIPACRHCFCKHHCAGGCLHDSPALGEVDDFRCRVTRALTADQLVSALDGESWRDKEPDLGCPTK